MLIGRDKGRWVVFVGSKSMTTRKPVRPGIVLLEDVLKTLNISTMEAVNNLGDKYVSRELDQHARKKC